MDLLNKAKGMMGSSSSGSANPQQPGQQKDDFLDKGLSSVQQKMGMHSNKETNERMTDGAREAFEKHTGKKVPHSVRTYDFPNSCSSQLGANISV